MSTKAFYVFVLLLAYLSVTHSLTRYVDGVSGTSDGSNGYYLTIQSALTSNLNGATVLEIVVYPTTTYQVDFMVETYTPQIITIRSSGTTVVSINCAVMNSGFRFQDKSAVTFAYLKMANCKSASPTVPLQFISVTSLTIQNCIFDKFNIGGVGGAVTLKNIASAAIQSTTVTSSTSANGGAVYIENSVVQISNSAFSTNSAQNQGGAIFVGTSSSWARTSFTVNLTDSSVQSNAATNGGAVAIFGDASSQIYVGISNTNFKNNQAIYGGALYVVDAAVAVNGGTLQNNTVPCSTGGLKGGAVYIASAANSITRGSFEGCTFTNNVACKSGGAIYYDVSSTVVSSGPVFKALQISGNSAQLTAGIYTTGASASYNTCNFSYNTGSEVIRANNGSVDTRTLYIFNNSAAAINCSKSSFTFIDPHIWGNQPDFPCPADQCTFAVSSPSILASKFNSCDACSRDACTFCAGDSQSTCTTNGTSSSTTGGTTSSTSATSTSTTGTTGSSTSNTTTGSGTTGTSVSATTTSGTSGITAIATTGDGTSTSGTSSTTDNSPATTSSDTGNGEQKQKSSSNIGIIAGGAAGGGLLLSVIIVLVVLLVRRKKPQHNNPATIGLSINPEQDRSMDINYQRWSSSNSGTRNSYEFSDTSYQSIGSHASPHLSAISITRGEDTPYSSLSAFTFPTIEGATVISYQDLDCQKELGRGSFGIVFKGVYEGRTVAVKQILGELNEKQVNAIADEARIMTSVPPHPNVITLIGVVSYPPCIVSKFYQNGSLLYYLLDKQKNLSKQDSYKIIHGITAGMAHLAKYKIVHRDLAARNILLDENMCAIVSDFGFARALQEDEHSGKTYTSIGPIKWMALEALTQRIYSEKSDVWSWAVTVWECLTRQPPWPGSDNVNTILAVSTGKRLPVPEICSPRFGQLMQACWKVDPEARPTFEELLEEVTKMGEAIFV